MAIPGLRLEGVRSLLAARVSTGVGALLSCACSDAAAPKAWSEFAACLAGPAATLPVVERVQKLRAAQLASWPAKGKEVWPTRCTPQAEALYTATADVPMLHRKLKERLACQDEPGHCVLVADDALVPSTVELWEAATDAKLKPEPVAGVAGPALAAAPAVDAKSWKSFSEKPARVVGPTFNADGSGTLLLVAKEGRARPRFCKLAAGLATVKCADAHASVPELPAQSIELARDGRGLFATGLTEQGLAAYNLETGARSDVRGTARHYVSDGVAIETGTEKQAGMTATSAEVPELKAVATVSAKGLVAIEVRGGKASGESKLSIEPVGSPLTLGKQIVYVAGAAPATTLEVKNFSGGRVADAVSIKGAFVGPFHTCASGDRTAVATFAPRSGERSSKATAGSDKTQLAIAFRTGDSWSKAAEGTLPFDRALDSGLVCTRSGASVAWVRVTPGGVELGRVDCTADGCQPATTQLPGVESKWWLIVAPLGDKTLLLWRSTYGETRFRVASLADFAQAADQILFDSPDFGGPVAGEATTFATDAAALLIFNQERPIALRIGADNRASVLAP